MLPNARLIAGDEYLVLDRPLSALTDYLIRSSSFQVQLSCPVISIQHGGTRVVVTCMNQNVITCNHAVLAVPLTTLKRREIQFKPALPTWKQTAIQRLQMSIAIKASV